MPTRRDAVCRSWPARSSAHATSALTSGESSSPSVQRVATPARGTSSRVTASPGNTPSQTKMPICPISPSARSPATASTNNAASTHTRGASFTAWRP
ncbi:MAG: hypothetical protein IPJ04_02100 [Candidatus Eisenbacteria bacterium]|nr:hypothetical protein [Candidatus Eisenbacteria bacterium]